MILFAKRTNITNDEVEKFLHVSDATAAKTINRVAEEAATKAAKTEQKFDKDNSKLFSK